MSYIVVYQRGDGSSGLEECADLELAVVAAERLRNVDDVESPRIFKTEEIHFDFRPYYRVEVSKAADPVVSAPSETASVPEVALDPWAEAEIPPAPSAPPVDRVADVEPPAVPAEASAEIPAEVAAETEVETHAEPGSTDIAAEEPVPDPVDEPDSRGLFSGEHIPDPPQEFPAVTHLADDVNEAVPPRRGLFGR
jgi:hypothetical protein